MRDQSVRLAYAPPYDWDQMIAFFAARAIAGVEHVAHDTYTRSISLGGAHGIIAVAPGRPRELQLRVYGPHLNALPSIIERVRRLFDLGVDLARVNAHLHSDRLLAPLVAARPGLRVAGAWDGFELAVRAILGQQITVVAARQLAGRLGARFGERIDLGPGGFSSDVTHVFPSPRELAAADVAALGMPRARASAVNALARAVERDPLILARGRTLEEAVRALRALPGIGEWTAQYIAMREHRETDAFPAGDVGLRRALAQRLGRPVSPQELLAHAERWRPWRAYGAAHLWAGQVSSSK